MSMPFLDRGEFFSLLCALLWAMATVLFKRSGDFLPPVALNFYKNSVALFLLIPTVFFVEGGFFITHHSPQDWLQLLVSGVIGIGIADTLFFAMLNRLGAGVAAIVDCLYSPLVIIFAAIFLREQIGWPVLIGMTMMVSAIVLGTWQTGRRGSADSISRPSPPRLIIVGVLLGVVSMIFMAGGIVIAKPVLEHSPVLWTTLVRIFGGTVFLLVQGLLPNNRQVVLRAMRPGRHWRVALPASILGSYLSVIAWMIGMKFSLASTASVLNQMSAILTVLLGAAFLSERLTWRKMGAALLAFAGTIIVIF